MLRILEAGKATYASEICAVGEMAMQLRHYIEAIEDDENTSVYQSAMCEALRELVLHEHEELVSRTMSSGNVHSESHACRAFDLPMHLIQPSMICMCMRVLLRHNWRLPWHL